MKKLLIALGAIIVVTAGYLAWLSHDSASDTSQAPAPVITTDDILNASDLADGVKQAVANGNENAIDEWLAKGQDVAEQAGLSERDIQYLTSDKARDYVTFNAKRALFNEAFEQRFVALQPIDDLKTQYPEAKSFFSHADKLIKKRDQIIRQIAQTLAQGNDVSAEDKQAARQLWQQRYQKKQADHAGHTE
ncbi:hypothetical protein [Salinimonas lutimaris]|uniref:hypothetical protein n=1 Tax=Salinimonas lutimaris TaxID=914153 RepID=UPI0010C0A9B1|nr:hypothetical protein [Salinimonas lutimaris]